MTVSEQVGRNLRKARREAFMGQEELSRRAGLHHSEIGLLERGLRVPRLDTAIKILTASSPDC